jgi:GT2 family glycosyltransferase
VNDLNSEGPGKEPDVSILIVGYNSADLIARCLGSIAPACMRHTYETILVDQGDGSTQAVTESLFPNVTVIPSQGNLGFAGGNNLLAARASGRNLLLLNPDVELKSGAVDALLDAARKHSGASAWGGVTLDRNDQPDIGNTVHIPTLSEMASRVVGRSNVALRPGQSFDADEKVEVLSGGFVLITRSAWDEAGGLDDRYFLYCEEVDFFYRLAKNGHTFWRIADARAHHDIGHGEVASPMRTLYGAAGVMQFARLHWSSLRENSAFILIWLGALQRYTIGSLLGLWHPRFRELAKANRPLAIRPGDWRYGYDPKRGLLAKLNHKSKT